VYKELEVLYWFYGCNSKNTRVTKRWCTVLYTMFPLEQIIGLAPCCELPQPSYPLLLWSPNMMMWFNLDLVCGEIQTWTRLEHHRHSFLACAISYPCILTNNMVLGLRSTILFNTNCRNVLTSSITSLEILDVETHGWSKGYMKRSLFLS
jgi:hypothetical protein